MAASETSTAPAELSDIKRKLAWRMGFAGLMIVALLGGLSLFDYFQARVEPESAAPTFTEPVPVPKKAQTQPVTPAEPAPERKAAEPEASAAPVDKSAPAIEPPPRPEVAAKPALPRASSAPRAAQKSAETKPVESKAPVASAPPPAAAAAPRAEATPAPVQPSPPRLFSGYALQAGVFSDPRRAEELHARLMLEGIPSTVEARVQVGPFKTRAEAEAAREKLKGLGIEALLLPPRNVKR